jgi:glycosyltransferase involved in cell wall biosynthesis
MKSVAVVIPCLNEESTIGKVIADFRAQLPDAVICVVDNGSTDATADRAREAGAVVIHEEQPGKGYAVRKAFRLVEADVYVMVDGDDTYPADRVAALIEPVLSDAADIVVGSRLMGGTGGFRRRNRLGNKFFRWSINTLFRSGLTDVLSGYRAMSRGFVKRMQILAKGFEIEAEMTVMALNRGFRIVEIPAGLRSRPEDSESKISVVGDGLRILGEIFSLYCYYKPLSFFGGSGLLLLLLAFLSLMTGVPDPSSMAARILHPCLGIVGILSIAVGGILHVTTRRFQELDQRLDLLNDEISRPG